MLHLEIVTPTQKAAKNIRAKLFALQPKPKPIPITNTGAAQDVPINREVAMIENVVALSVPVVRPYLVHRKYPTLADVFNEVCDFYGVTEVDMMSARRHADIVRPRQVFCYLARELTTHSLPGIGRFLANRDHTSILHAFRKIHGLSFADARLRDELDVLRMRVSDVMTARNANHIHVEPIAYMGG